MLFTNQNGETAILGDVITRLSCNTLWLINAVWIWWWIANDAWAQSACCKFSEKKLKLNKRCCFKIRNKFTIAWIQQKQSDDREKQDYIQIYNHCSQTQLNFLTNIPIFKLIKYKHFSNANKNTRKEKFRTEFNEITLSTETFLKKCWKMIKKEKMT